jgi:hypothetical protein
MRSRHQSRRNPSRRRFRVPSLSPLFHRREATQETRKEVRHPPASLVVIPVHHAVQVSSSEFPCRAAASTRRSAASTRRSAALPPLPLPLLASPACACRIGAFSALNRGLELEIEFTGEVTARAAASPLAAG